MEHLCHFSWLSKFLLESKCKNCKWVWYPQTLTLPIITSVCWVKNKQVFLWSNFGYKYSCNICISLFCHTEWEFQEKRANFGIWFNQSYCWNVWTLFRVQLQQNSSKIFLLFKSKQLIGIELVNLLKKRGLSNTTYWQHSFSDLAILTPREFCLYEYMKKCYWDLAVLFETGLPESLCQILPESLKLDPAGFSFKMQTFLTFFGQNL